MITEEFKQQAFAKLDNTSPENIVEILKSIGCVQVKSPDEFFNDDNEEG